MTYLYLTLAIVSEVIATSFLKSTKGFTQLVPALIVVAGYCSAFFLLSLVVRSIPVSIVYAVWSGAGIVLIALVGWLWFKQTLDVPAIVGMVFILIGVVVINLFSKTVRQ